MPRKPFFNEYYGKRLRFYAVYVSTSKEKDKSYRNAENAKRQTVLLRSIANPELDIYLDHVWVKHVAGLDNLVSGDFISFDAMVVRYERRYTKTTHVKYHALPPLCGIDFLNNITLLTPEQYEQCTEPLKKTKPIVRKKRTRYHELYDSEDDLPCSKSL